MHDTTRPGAQRGQVLVLVAMAIVAMLAVLGLIIDGGYVYSQQRGAQNGSDAASTAGALVIAHNLPYRALGEAGPMGDGDVAAAVAASTSANGIGTYRAIYTDLDGNPVGANVGDGTLPSSAWGVKVDADRAFDTFFIRVVGINTLQATTTATAIAGYVENAGAGNVLPVIIPLNIIECDNTGAAVVREPVSLWELNQTVTLPLCRNGAPGNIGWLDWDPGDGGGTSELRDAIRNPSNPAIPVPSWQWVPSTGNVADPQVEEALRGYIGETVLIPFFDNTCDTPGPADNAECPDGSDASGQNTWYHIPLFFGFRVDNVYTGPSGAACGFEYNQGGCLIGTITNFVGPNVTVGAGTGTSLDARSAVGVQLIK